MAEDKKSEWLRFFFFRFGNKLHFLLLWFLFPSVRLVIRVSVAVVAVTSGGQVGSETLSNPDGLRPKLFGGNKPKPSLLSLLPR